MSEEELRSLIRDTVRETLEALGFDLSRPAEVQADLRALRDWRVTMRVARRGAVVTLAGAVATAACAALWLGVKAMLRRGE